MSTEPSSGNIIAEYDTSNALQARHVFGPGVDEALVSYDASGNRNWLLADERGSIVARTNAAGTATAIRGYNEYGIPSGGDVGRFGYTGQAWLPELGMAYYKARIYSPTLGRFMQTDPIGYGDGINLYDYVGGDPVNFTDPAGLCRFGETKMRIPNPGFSVLVNDEWVATAKVGCVRLVERDEVGYHSPGGGGGKQGQPQNDDGEEIVVTGRLAAAAKPSILDNWKQQACELATALGIGGAGYAGGEAIDRARQTNELNKPVIGKELKPRSARPRFSLRGGIGGAAGIVIEEVLGGVIKETVCGKQH